MIVPLEFEIAGLEHDANSPRYLLEVAVNKAGDVGNLGRVASIKTARPVHIGKPG